MEFDDLDVGSDRVGYNSTDPFDGTSPEELARGISCTLDRFADAPTAPIIRRNPGKLRGVPDPEAHVHSLTDDVRKKLGKIVEWLVGLQ